MKFIRYSTRCSQAPTFDYGTLLNDLDRLFEAGTPASRSGAFPIDIYQDKNAVIVRAELPGFRKEDLQVNVADNVLTIVGHVKEADKKDAAKTETSVERKVALPENLNDEKVTAAYENGVLTVTLPKREEAKPTTVAIEIK